MVATANELVIPTGVPVKLKLKSGDVIHDFWVPKLGPKMDMIPGRTNQTWLEADKPGTYRGQCAEYCGLEHARMAFVVRAVSPGDFKLWMAHQLQACERHRGPLRQRRAAARPAESDASGTGAASENPAARCRSSLSSRLFVARCGACHTVRGTGAGGIAGPGPDAFRRRAAQSPPARWPTRRQTSMTG